MVTKTVDRKSRRLALPKIDIFTLGKWIWNWKSNEIMLRRFVGSLEDWQTPPMATTSSFLIGYILCGKWKCKWSQKRKLNQLTLRWYQHKTLNNQPLSLFSSISNFQHPCKFLASYSYFRQHLQKHPQTLWSECLFFINLYYWIVLNSAHTKHVCKAQKMQEIKL